MTLVRSVVSLLSFLVVASSAPAQVSSDPSHSPLTAAQMREDIATFRTEFMGRDRSYAPAARTQAEARLGELEARLERTTPLGFELALAQIVALADNAHTIVPPPARARRYNRVPVRMATFGDDFRVLRASAPNADLLGARLVSIDGRGVAELSTRRAHSWLGPRTGAIASPLCCSRVRSS